jgi:hypothetical protein
MGNLLSKTPYKFKKSYGSSAEPQTPQDAPWLRGPSLKSKLFISRSCPFLVLTTILGRLRHAGAKNGAKYYKWPTDFPYTFFNF